MSIEQSLVEQLVNDIKEIVKARVGEEALERFIVEKLSEKFDEFVKRLGGSEGER
jgi:phosphoribosyl-ATP pyrophosphohydrolase